MIESFEDWYANNLDADYDDVVAKVKQWVEFCEDMAYDCGYEEGHSQGYSDGYDEGYEDGVSDTYEREHA